MNRSPQIRVAIFASGTGTNAQKLIDYFADHDRITVALIVCNRPGAGVLDIARDYGLASILTERDRFFTTGYVDELRMMQIDWIVLAGFLWKIPGPLLKAYPSKIINLHPALLPAYGGKGMYGMAVHQAVISAGDTKSGITIHFVDEEYDRGPVIFQKEIAVDKTDTPESLAQKIQQLEHTSLAPAIEQVILQAEE